MTNGSALSPKIHEQTNSILVVEDDVPLRFALAEWFRLLGYTVYEAATADEAVILLDSPILIHLVITDIDMPGTINGLELVDYIDSTAPGMHVIVVSGQDQKIRKSEVLFFRKPYDLQKISSLISTMLNTESWESDRE